MRFFSRYPIIVWFLVIALITSVSVSYYTYEFVYHKQTEEVIDSELARISQRMIQLQGTVNDFNRRNDDNAIHREVSRLTSDETMELIAIVDEHGYIKYSSLIEYRDVLAKDIPEIFMAINDKDAKNVSGSIGVVEGGDGIVGVYPLNHISHKVEHDGYFYSYLFAQFDLSHTLKELHYRQRQEITRTTLIHFTLLFAGFLLLYISMQSRLKSILNGIVSFSEGDYGSRIKLDGADEFSKISNGFDSMASKLQAQNQGLTDLAGQLHMQHQELLLQEQDLRVTLNSIGDAVIATDSEGLVTRMNPVAQTLTGWTLDDASGKPITSVFKIVDAVTRQTIDNPVDKVIKTGQTVYLSNNTTLISRDGSEYQISDSAAPIRNENNVIQGMVLIFNDVTEQYRLRQAAAKSEYLLRSIMDNSPAMIYVINRSGEFTYGNKQFQAVFDLDKDDVVGASCHDVFMNSDAEEMYKNDMIVLNSEQTFEIEENIQLDDGMHVYSSIKFPLVDETEQTYAVCSISTDVTERVEQEQLLRRSQKMDALGKLTGGIAHDYNNMLGVIMGYSEMLKDALSDDEKLHKFANEIVHASERGVNLTKKLLAFSRPQQSKKEPLIINELLLDRQDVLDKVLTARIKLEMELCDNPWPVLINSSDLEDAVVNIAINAMHAMENGGQLTIRTSNTRVSAQDAEQLQIEVGDYLRIEFADTGIGMDKETQDKMFDPFFTSKGDLGVGLGLSQVYGLVESNNGAIKVDSEPDHGTSIEIYLPRMMVEETNAVTKTSIFTENLTGTGVVLVVDDEPALRLLVHEILTQNGYSVLTAENGKQALEILKHEAVDVLFSDVIMPEIDGYELADKVQQSYPNIKIQLASGYNDVVDSGANKRDLHASILYKPYSAFDVLRCIKDLTTQSD